MTQLKSSIIDEIYIPRKTILNNKPKILLFGGGTAQHEITKSLMLSGANVTRIVSAVDDGGSSGVLRNYFGTGPVGDIRKAMVSMSQVSCTQEELLRLLSYRFPKIADQKDLRMEFEKMISGEHVLIRDIHTNIKGVIISFLSALTDNMRYIRETKGDLTLNNASIGNLILLGAYFKYSNNINISINNLKKLCQVEGTVFPTTTDGSIYLGAILEDESIILGQSNITKLDRIQNRHKIKEIFLFRKEGTDYVDYAVAEANPEVTREIRAADLIVYGPGSFFTSVLPHLLIDKIAETIANRDVPKILIGNIFRDNETYNLNLETLVDIFLKYATDKCAKQSDTIKFITHVMANKPTKFLKSSTDYQLYLPLGNLDSLIDVDISIILKDYENHERRGHHEPRTVANDVLSLEILN